jgi:UDP-N-acetylglucosamine acyltransferase
VSVRRNPLSKIHSTAVIDPKAELASDVEVGPYTVIGPEVRIGEGTVIGPHVVIKGITELGRNNRVFQFASIGDDNQDRKYKGEPTRTLIGDGNSIRECVTIHRGTIQDEGITQVGDNNLLMAYVHLGHDCVVGSHCTLANNATCAGHVHVGDCVILGGFTAVHQFCRIGPYAMAAGTAGIRMDVPAYMMASGNPAIARGMNFEGMKRRGYSPELRSRLKDAYKTLYMRGLKLDAALERLREEARDCPEIGLLVDSVEVSTRGIIRP